MTINQDLIRDIGGVPNAPFGIRGAFPITVESIVRGRIEDRGAFVSDRDYYSVSIRQGDEITLTPNFTAVLHDNQGRILMVDSTGQFEASGDASWLHIRGGDASGLGGVQTGNYSFYIDSKSVPGTPGLTSERFDSGNAYSWQSISTTYAPDLVTKTRQENSYDDGRYLIVNYGSDGKVDAKAWFDLEDAFSWERYRISFAADGVTKEIQVNDYDDGRQLWIDFDGNGKTASKAWFDKEDEFEWETYVETFAADGTTKVQQHNVYDDGRELIIDYDANGTKVSKSWVDTDDAFIWETYVEFFAADGVTKSRQLNSYDNGRKLLIDYDANGDRVADTWFESSDEIFLV